MPSANALVRHAAVMLEKAGRSEKAPIWSKASEMLSAPAKNEVEVNVGRLSRLSESGAAIFVPGKVLGTGVLDKKLFVGAFAFSPSARTKIESSGGSALTIESFLKKYPKGNGVRLVK